MTGIQRGLAIAVRRWPRALGVVAAVAVAAAGCSRDEQEPERRKLLAPVDTSKAVEERRKARQIFDEQGELLPSDQKVAGLVLPKGLRLLSQSERRWSYQADRIPYAKLADYFARQLMSKSVERSERATLFSAAVPATDLRARPLQVRVVALRGSPVASRVTIEQAKPFQPALPPEVVEAQLRARRAHLE